jgi:hypothetical protein
MTCFSHSSFRVDMHNNLSQILEVQKQLMPYVLRDVVPFRHRERRGNRDIDFDAQAVSNVACSCLTDLLHAADKAYCVYDVVEQVWLDTVK